MNRSLKALVAIPLLVSACSGSETEDELAGETSADAAGDGKADGAVDGAYTYFTVSPDLRACVSPLCGGYVLRRVNRTSTVCHTGASADSCYVPELDFSQSNLSAALQSANIALVRGRFASKTYPGFGDMGRFIVTEAWVAEGDGAPDGVFVKARDNGVRCIAAPCASINEKALNTSRWANIAAIDWSAGSFDDAQVSAFATDMTKPSGVILAGDRYSFKTNGIGGKGRTATAVYTRLVDAAPCYVGGCSSQICSDQEGVISTCEWREEYACYQSATCERQADDTCGWTQTAELDACLANPATP